MLHSISKRLAPLASLNAQRRFIINATRDKYLLPEELIEDAYDVVRQVRTMPAARDALTAEAVHAIIAIEPLLTSLNLAGKSPEQLVDQDLAWRAVREQAAYCLRLMGFDFSRMGKDRRLSQHAVAAV